MDVLQHWGFNAITISFLGTVFFSLLTVWGLWHQAKTMFVEKSAESISSTWAILDAAGFSMSFLYGVAIKDPALIFCGPIALFHLPILWGIAKFRKFTWFEETVGMILLIVIGLSIFLPLSAKHWFFVLFGLLSLGALATIALEIWRNQSSGVVEFKLLAVWLVSTLFWVVYAFATQNPILQIYTLMVLSVVALAILAWLKYRKSPEPADLSR